MGMALTGLWRQPFSLGCSNPDDQIQGTPWFLPSSVQFSISSTTRALKESGTIHPMPRLEGLGNIVTELRAERAHLVNNLRHVDAALAVLGKLEGGKFATASRRSLSATARRRMAAAQKARWAKVKTGGA